MSANAEIAPEKITNLGLFNKKIRRWGRMKKVQKGHAYCFMARIAAMKNVLSPTSDTRIMAMLAMNADPKSSCS